MPIARCLVVALGNPLMGDDGFGASVLGQVRNDPELARAVDFRDAGTDLLGAIDDLASYDQVVLIDAVLDAEHSGFVRVFQEATFSSWPESTASAHQISPLTAIKLFRRLHPEAKTGITLVGLCTDEIRFGQGPCPTTATEAGATAVRHLLTLKAE